MKFTFYWNEQLWELLIEEDCYVTIRSVDGTITTIEEGDAEWESVIKAIEEETSAEPF